MKNILIQNVLILPMSSSSAESYVGDVGLAGGKIVMVSRGGEKSAEFCSLHDGVEVIDGSGKVLMPGLINTHCHVSMTLMRGYGDDMPLMPWLNERIWPLEAKLTGEDIRIGAALGIAEMLLGGTTCFVDMYWQEVEVAKAVDTLGIRAVLAPTFVDARYDEFKGDLDSLLAEYDAHPRIMVKVAPHALYTCSKEHIVEAFKIARDKGLGLHIHIAETEAEMEMIKEKYGYSPIELLHEWGLLGEDVMSVHTVYTSDNDIELLSKYGVSVVNNPQSNMKLASGSARISDMVAKGVNVSVGTDGASSNNDLDMWEELRTASFVQKLSDLNPCSIPAYNALRMATYNGAKAIGMEGKLGVIAEGAIADLILIDIDKPHMYPRHDIIANLVYCGKSSDVDTVIIGGEIVVKGGKLLTGDVKAICLDAEKSVASLLAK